jgi:serine/threonine-protein kinase TTK/MPS1
MLKSTIDTHAQSVGQKNNEANLLIDTEKSTLEALSSQITSCNALMGESFKKGQLDLDGNPQLTSQSKKPFLSLILYCKVVYMFSYQFTLQVII